MMLYVDVSENSGTPKSSILIGFSIINHPFWGTVTDRIIEKNKVGKCPGSTRAFASGKKK